VRAGRGGAAGAPPTPTPDPFFTACLTDFPHRPYNARRVGC
jgi:hypothetical protein